MANGSITGSRISVHVFVADVLGGGRAEVEDSANGGWRAIRVEDGFGTSVVISGDRSSLRLLVSRLLDGLQPDSPTGQDQGGAS